MIPTLVAELDIATSGAASYGLTGEDGALYFASGAEIAFTFVAADGTATALTYGADYTISGDGTQGTGLFTPTTPANLPAGGRLAVRRATAQLQQEQWSPGNFDAPQMQRVQDRNRLIDQEVSAKSARSLRAQDYGLPLAPLPDPSTVINKPFHMGADGKTPTAFNLTMDELEQQPTNAAASAAEAADYAGQAGTARDGAVAAKTAGESARDDAAADAAAAVAARDAAIAAAASIKSANVYATVTLLKGLASSLLTDGDQAFVGSYLTIGGKGYGTWVWRAASSATADDVMVAKPNDISVGNGRWVRVTNSFIDFAWWDPDSTGTTAVTAKIQAALNVLGALPYGGTLLIPPGQFKIDDQVQVDWLQDSGDISGGKMCKLLGMGTRASQFVSSISNSAKSMFYFGGGSVGARAQGLALESLGFIAAHDPSTYVTTSNEKNLVFCNFTREARFNNLLFYGGKGTQLCLGRPQNIQGNMIEVVGDQTYTQYGIRFTSDDASYGSGVPTGSNQGQGCIFTGVSGRGHRSSSVKAASIYLENGSEHTISGKIIESSQFAVISNAAKCKISDFSWESSHVGDIGILMLGGDSCEISGWSVATVDGSLNEYVWLYCADASGTYTGSYNGLDIHDNKLMDTPTGAVIHFGDGDGNRHSMFHHNFNFDCRANISLNASAEGKVFIFDNREGGTTPGYITTTGATPNVANAKRIAHIDGSAVTITQWMGVCPGEFYSMQFNGNQTIAVTGPIKLLGSATPSNGTQVLFWCSPTVTSSGLPVMEEVARPAH